jgi:hypothetical protein
MKAWWMVAVVAVGLLGCEMADTGPSPDEAGNPQPSSSDNNTPSPSPAPADNSAPTAAQGEQAEWDAITWHTAKGPNCRGAQPVMSLQATVIEGGEKVRFSFDRFPWSSDGHVHFFVWTGDHWDGGKFDWIRKGGQSVKLMENVAAGYNGLSIPRSGTPVAYAWTDEGGRQRSNLSKTTWP